MLCADGRQVRAVAFDMDGLMFDSEMVASGLWRDAGAEHGWEFSRELLHKLVGQAGKAARKILAEELGTGFPYDTVREKRLELERHYYRDNPVPLKPGLMELLDSLAAAGLPLGLATSTPRVRVTPMLAKAGIADRFACIVCGDEVEHAKPDPEAYLKVMEKLGVAPGECLVLEDSRAGVAAAHGAGAMVVMVPDMVQPDDAARARAFRIFASLHDVREWLESCG